MLSDIKIKSEKSSGKNKKISDGDGLCLLLHANGSKYWQFRYSFGGKPKVLSIGKYPTVSLAEARIRKSDAQRLLRDFIDPSARKQEQKKVAAYQNRNTFIAVAKEWHDRNKAVWSNGHALKIWRRLEIHILPALGKRPISEIKPLEVLSVVQKVEAKGGTDVCARVLWICSAVFQFAIITGRAEHNAARDLKGALKRYKETHHPSLKAKEMPAFLAALEGLDTSEQNRIAFKVLLMTALRTGELRHGRWEDVDFGSKEWRVPAEAMKMRREHIVPLSEPVVVLLERLKSLNGHQEWMFPNSRRQVHPIMSENTINDMIERMGYKGKVVGHGFRSMFSTVLNENGFNRDAIERQLAHVEGNSVRAAYNQAEYLPERRVMMQWWANFVEGRGKSSLELPPFTTPPQIGPTEMPHSFLGIQQSNLLN